MTRDNSPPDREAPANDPWRERACAHCGKPATQAYRPFCSKRCADIDLSRWLGGRYAIAQQPGDEDEWDSLTTEADNSEQRRSNEN